MVTLLTNTPKPSIQAQPFCFPVRAQQESPGSIRYTTLDVSANRVPHARTAMSPRRGRRRSVRGEREREREREHTQE